MDTYKLGFVAGFCFVIIAALIARKIFHREPTIYDERQERIRGIAYKYAFATMCIAAVAYIFLCGIGFEGIIESALAVFIIIIAGVMTYACYCIVKGAYFGINNNKTKWIVLDLVIVVINAVCAVGQIANGSYIKNGVLHLAGTANLICAVAFGGVLIALVVKEMKDRKEGGGEDEESEG